MSARSVARLGAVAETAVYCVILIEVCAEIVKGERSSDHMQS
jgi:hypothetical protein